MGRRQSCYEHFSRTVLMTRFSLIVYIDTWLCRRASIHFCIRMVRERVRIAKIFLKRSAPVVPLFSSVVSAPEILKNLRLIFAWTITLRTGSWWNSGVERRKRTSVSSLDDARQTVRIEVPQIDDDAAFECAREICSFVGVQWTTIDRLPSKYLFDYEKDVITTYIQGKGNFPLEMVRDGCPPKWPIVRRIPDLAARWEPNPIPRPISGSHREALIRVDARMTEQHAGSFLSDMVFPEAGPRKEVFRYPQANQLRAAILVSGGLAPGVNAAIEAIVSRHRLYEEWSSKNGRPSPVRLIGYQEGFKALTRDWGGATTIGEAGRDADHGRGRKT